MINQIQTTGRRNQPPPRLLHQDSCNAVVSVRVIQTQHRRSSTSRGTTTRPSERR